MATVTLRINFAGRYNANHMLYALVSHNQRTAVVILEMKNYMIYIIMIIVYF